MAIKWPLKATLLIGHYFCVSFNGTMRVIVLVSGPDLLVMKKSCQLKETLFRGIKFSHFFKKGKFMAIYFLLPVMMAINFRNKLMAITLKSCQ